MKLSFILKILSTGCGGACLNPSNQEAEGQISVGLKVAWATE